MAAGYNGYGCDDCGKKANGARWVCQSCRTDFCFGCPASGADGEGADGEGADGEDGTAEGADGADGTREDGTGTDAEEAHIIEASGAEGAVAVMRCDSPRRAFATLFLTFTHIFLRARSGVVSL